MYLSRVRMFKYTEGRSLVNSYGRLVKYTDIHQRHVKFADRAVDFTRTATKFYQHSQVQFDVLDARVK